MACNITTESDGRITISCTRGQPPARQCITCFRSEPRTTLYGCAYPLRGEKQGQLCSRPVCAIHGHHGAMGEMYCPAHGRIIQEGGLPA